MKRFPLLPQVALVFAAVYACSDATAPANSHSLLRPNDPEGTVGKPPPPPVSTAIAVTITSVPRSAVFTGVYFSNGVLDDVGTPTETFDGTAWLRLDNNNMQPGLGGTASANARFMVHGMNLSGSGTLYFGPEREAFTIVSVQSFSGFADCGPPIEGSPSPCAAIEFTVVDAAGDTHFGHLVASDKASCILTTGFFNPDCPVPNSD